MKKLVALFLVFVIGFAVSLWLPDMLNLEVNDNTWSLRIYRAYHVLWGGLLFFCLQKATK